MLFQNTTSWLTETSNASFRPNSACGLFWIQWPSEKPNLSDQHLGAEIQKMLIPVHYTCVPDKDLYCNPPKYTDFDPLGRQSCHQTRSSKLRISQSMIFKRCLSLRWSTNSTSTTKSVSCHSDGGTWESAPTVHTKHTFPNCSFKLPISPSPSWLASCSPSLASCRYAY